jgi:RNA recognition motif-containing protein
VVCKQLDEELMNDTFDTPQENKKKLYIGNLPWSMSEEDVKGMCEPYGELVEVNLITFADSGRSRGFAFAEYADEESAERAIEALNDNEIEGRKLFVKVAQPRKPRRDGDRRGGGFRGGRRNFNNDRNSDHRGGYRGGRNNDRRDNNRRDY